MKTTINNPRTTTKQEQKIAQESVRVVQGFENAFEGTEVVHVDIHTEGPEESFMIPKGAFDLLVFILDSMAEGKAISIALVEAELSTQQAADLLAVSRPHLINKLLEPGLIPFSTVGKHRRIKLKDIIHYKEERRKKRKNNLQFLADQAQELNMGY